MENKEINDILSGAYAQARADFIPVCSHFCRNLLCDLARQTDPERILEIGTAVGYSAACMALACRARVDTQGQATLGQTILDEKAPAEERTVTVADELDRAAIARQLCALLCGEKEAAR